MRCFCLFSRYPGDKLVIRIVGGGRGDNVRGGLSGDMFVIDVLLMVPNARNMLVSSSYGGYLSWDADDFFGGACLG